MVKSSALEAWFKLNRELCSVLYHQTYKAEGYGKMTEEREEKEKSVDEETVEEMEKKEEQGGPEYTESEEPAKKD